jgi:hypothetical protein
MDWESHKVLKRSNLLECASIQEDLTQGGAGKDLLFLQYFEWKYQKNTFFNKNTPKKNFFLKL